MIYLGIDPGVTGGIALLYADSSIKKLVVLDIPTAQAGTGKTKKEIDVAGLADMLRPYAQQIKLAGLERVHSMPQQSSQSGFSLGDSFGAIRGVLAALGIPVIRFEPARWKRHMKIPTGSDKEASRAFALSLFPANAADLKRVKDHNRAEGMLIAQAAKDYSERVGSFN